MNPGDTRSRTAPRTSPGPSLNEGRGVNPGDTRIGAQDGSNINLGAQRRPGREPRRHARRQGTAANPPSPLNEGRGVNPGDTRGARRWPRPSRAALNEGRGVNPGDTRMWSRRSGQIVDAQRRPGREPRRHAGLHADARCRPPSLNEGRGVNPGDTANPTQTAKRGRNCPIGRTWQASWKRSPGSMNPPVKSIPCDASVQRGNSARRDAA